MSLGAGGDQGNVKQWLQFCKSEAEEDVLGVWTKEQWDISRELCEASAVLLI